MTSVEVEIRNKKLILETGELAKQSDGAVVVKYGETIVLATVVADKEVKEGKDFLPLTIDYQEKAYSAGKIPGGFLKREGRLSEKEVITSRIIDRPIRPLFPKSFYSETQGIVSVLSYGDEYISDVLGIIAMSGALTISDIPFEGPVGSVRVGRLNGELIVNPSVDSIGDLDLDIIVAGTEEAVTMVEGSAFEVSEDVLLSAIDFAHTEIKRIVDIQKRLGEKIGEPKRTVMEIEKDESLIQSVRDFVIARMKDAIKIPDKQQRQKEIDSILNEAIEHFCQDDNDKRIKEIASYFDEIERDLVRGLIINEGVRVDGRRPDEIRPITSRIGFLPRAHGSALFVRGETQALAVVTLGTSSDEKKIDSLDGDSYKSFMLHYNFPPFSVGEVKPLRSPGRREIGHGILAEKALSPVIPSSDKFPYTIRVVSDILESNGSSSMATVCGSTLALMDAGTPINDPVAGIAMGLIKENDTFIVLTDILGLEDHLGDMDFKVAGTEKGITAFQMDVKIKGVSREVMENALARAREGRLFILNKIRETISAPRENLSANAPRIYQMRVKKEKIKDVIGTGGKVIRSIIDATGVKIDIDDEGLVNIASKDGDSLTKAKEIIEGIVEEPEIGRLYRGKVKKIMDFGAFVEILPGTEGLCHISQISDRHIRKVSDEIKEGDEILVKVLDIDRAGKIRLSRKEAMSEKK